MAATSGDNRLPSPLPSLKNGADLAACLQLCRVLPLHMLGKGGHGSGAGAAVAAPGTTSACTSQASYSRRTGSRRPP